MAAFERYIGIDYSGAETARSPLRGLQIYMSEAGGEPAVVKPPPSARKHWTREGVAQWLILRLNEPVATIAGIDHGFSFPEAYFAAHDLERNWDRFLDDFCGHWPTGAPHTYVDFVRDGLAGNGAARMGNARWLRMTEQRCKPRPKSVFHFDVPGSVAKSTHAGLPWLRMARTCCQKVHFWPFDGFDVPPGRSLLAEVYPSKWSRLYAAAGRTPDEQDAYAVARWLADADRDGWLAASLRPQLCPAERAVAGFEGWILGVV